MKYLLPFLLQQLTGKPRYLPDVKWDKRVYVVNIFRLWEKIFGRRYGIRAEASTAVKYENGKLYIKREFYTIEAFLAHIEVTIRSHLFFLQSLFINMPLQYQATYVTFAGFGIILSFHVPLHLLPLFGLNISLDVATTSTAGTASPFTWSHTQTGSNMMLAITVGLRAGLGQPTTTAASYNSVGATKADSKQETTDLMETSIWLISGGATGSNTVSVTWTTGSAGNNIGGVSISYTGAKQTNTADAHNNLSLHTSSTGDKTFAVTTVASNCWIVMIGMATSTTSATCTADQTSRGTQNYSAAGPNTILRSSDTNGSVSTGSNTIGFTVGGGGTFAGYCMSGASFAPLGGPVGIDMQDLNNTFGAVVMQAFKRATIF